MRPTYVEARLRLASSLRRSGKLNDALETYQPVSYTHLRAHETVLDLVCRLLLEKKKTKLDNTCDQKESLVTELKDMCH